LATPNASSCLVSIQQIPRPELLPRIQRPLLSHERYLIPSTIDFQGCTIARILPSLGHVCIIAIALLVGGFGLLLDWGWGARVDFASMGML